MTVSLLISTYFYLRVSKTDNFSFV